MPEIPDLVNIQDFLDRKLPNVGIISVETQNALVLRYPSLPEFCQILMGNTFSGAGRRGKFLLLNLQSGHVLAVNPMLTGRIQYTAPENRRHARTCITLRLDNDKELRYFDSKMMGKIYLVPQGRMSLIPNFTRMGPEANDPNLTLEEFQKRLRRHPGQIKNILVSDAFIAGIGNAYADEILFAAGIHPFRRRSTLGEEEVARLLESMRAVLEEAMDEVGQRMGSQIELKIRDFMKVHGKGNRPCPQCGYRISQIGANQRLTNFCRKCQR